MFYFASLKMNESMEFTQMERRLTVTFPLKNKENIENEFFCFFGALIATLFCVESVIVWTFFLRTN